MGNDERHRPSWRDIDKRREGGGSSSSRGNSHEPRAGSNEDQRQKQYRAVLEAAFAKGELGKLADKLNITSSASSSHGRSAEEPRPTPAPTEASGAAATATAAAEGAAKKGGKGKKVEDERLLLRRKLGEASGRQEISRAAEKFLARYPLPDDHELLEQLLEHERESRVLEAIERIGAMIDRRQPPRRSRALCGKLRYIVETSAEGELRTAAQGLLNRLS